MPPRDVRHVRTVLHLQREQDMEPNWPLRLVDTRAHRLSDTSNTSARLLRHHGVDEGTSKVCYFPLDPGLRTSLSLDSRLHLLRHRKRVS